MYDATGQTDHTAFLTGFAEDYLRGARHVDVRPLTFDDIATLASGSAPQVFHAFRADESGEVTPVVVTVGYRHGSPSVNTTFAMNHATGRLDRSAPVGARISVDIETGFGGKSGGFLFTTERAEEESGFGSSLDANRLRASLALPAENPINETTPTESRPLAAVHGSEINLSCVVAGITPSDLEKWVRSLIETEFGDKVGAIVRTDTRVVGTQRVDVFDAESGAPLAVNVLAAEATYLMGKSESGLIQTRPASPSGLIVGR